MSYLFRGQGAPISAIGFQVFSPFYTNANGYPLIGNDGEVWYDAQQRTLYKNLSSVTTAEYGLVYQTITPVTFTTPGVSTNTVVSVSFPSTAINILNKNINFALYGNYTTAGGATPTLTLASTLGGSVVASAASAALTASSTTIPWEFKGVIGTQTVSTTGAPTGGAVEAHGGLTVVLGTSATAAASTYLVNNTATVGTLTLNSSVPLTLAFTAAFSTSTTANAIVLRQAQVWISN